MLEKIFQETVKGNIGKFINITPICRCARKSKTGKFLYIEYFLNINANNVNKIIKFIKLKI